MYIISSFCSSKPSKVESKLIRFSSLGHHLMFYLCHSQFHQFPILGSSFYLKLIFCSFCFSSLGRHPRFYLCLIFIHLVSNHWNVILCSTQDQSIVSFVSHHCDAIVVCIYVRSQFLWFSNIGMPAYVLYRFIVSFFDFQSLGSHRKLYLWLFICSFDFSSLRPHPRLYLCSL